MTTRSVVCPPPTCGNLLTAHSRQLVRLIKEIRLFYVVSLRTFDSLPHKEKLSNSLTMEFSLNGIQVIQ